MFKSLSLTFRTISFFTYHSFQFGIGVGVLMGSLLVPLFGSIAGGLAGIFIGTVLGAVTGLLVALYNRFGVKSGLSLQTYRRNLALAVGLSSGAVMQVGLLISLLCASGLNYTLFAVLHLLGLMSFVIPVALTMACIASQYADIYADEILDNPDSDWTELPARLGSGNVFSNATRWWAGRIVIAAVVIGSIFCLIAQSRQPGGTLTSTGVIGGGLTIGIMALFVILALNKLNVLALFALNRLYFDEYAPQLTFAQYQRRVMIALGLMTLVYSPVITVGIFAPVAAVIIALSAREYAYWHYGEVEKPKRIYAV